MTVSTGPVLCGSCKGELDESPQLDPKDRSPCPKCGAKTRIFNVEAHAKGTFRSKLGIKHKRPGFKKPIYEEVGGDDLHRKSGLWSKFLRVIDRQNNRYKEEIVNSETGEILRSVDEPLTEHVGRGYARKPKGSK
jgi:hypothetical protein